MRLELPEVAHRGRPRQTLEVVEAAAAGDRTHLQQVHQPLPIGGTDPAVGQLVEPRVDLSADLGDHVVESAVTGQLQPRPDQLFKRNVDQVGRVVLRQRRDPDHPLRQLPRRRGIQHHPDPLARPSPVPLPGPVRLVGRLDLRTQLQQAPHMLDHRDRHLEQVRKAPQLLKRLQQQHQRQQPLRRPGSLPRPVDLIEHRRERLVQLPSRDHSPEPWIRRALDRRHRTAPPQSNPVTRP